MATDDFNRANETPLAGNWTRLTGSTGNHNLVSNAVEASAAGDKAYTYTGGATTADQYSEITLAGSGNFDSIAACRGFGDGSGLDCYFAAAWTGGEAISKFVDTAWTEIQPVTITNCVAGDIVRLEVQGSTLRYYKNGSQATGSPTTDTSITAAGGVGFGVADVVGSSGSVTAWSGGDLGLPLLVPVAEFPAGHFGPF